MKVIITGATGMVGKGALLECLDDSRVSQVISLGRNSLGMNHDKLVEVIHKDFTDFSSLQQDFSGYDAIFHCMGVSSVGMNEEDFSRLTYDVTKSLADKCHNENPDMKFIYVSGTGTDTSETSRTMWQRVKGKTENYVLNLGFKGAYMFRPGGIIPEKGIKSRTKLYQFFYDITRPFFGLMKRLNSITTTTKLGKAMINVVDKGTDKTHLENPDINDLSTI